MSYSHIATGNVGDSSSGTSLLASGIVAAAGDWLVVRVEYASGTRIVESLSDGVNTYTYIDTLSDAGNGQSCALFECASMQAGTFNLTFSLASAAGYRGITWVRSSGVTALGAALYSKNLSSSPGTGANAITSGNITPSAADGGLIAFTLDCSANETGIAAGTGFTDRGAMANIESAFSVKTRVEEKAVTSTSAQAGTFTGTTGNGSYLTLAIYRPTSGGAALDQFGYRPMNDDASEASCTPYGAESAGFVSPVGTPRILNIGVNATGDPASKVFRLEYKKTTAGSWAAVPLSTPAAGSVAYSAAGTRNQSSGAISRNPALAAGGSNGDLHLAVVGSKNNVTHTSSSTGWVKLFQQNSGASWTVSVWAYRPTLGGADGSQAAPTITVAASNVACFSQCFRLSGFGSIGASNVNAGTTSTQSCTGITATGYGSRVIYLAASAANTALATPTGWTEDADNGNATGATVNEIGGKNLSNLGDASGDISVTGASAAWVMWQIEILPVQAPFILAASANIAAGGEATTARLTAPAGKTGTDFQAGRRWDDENGTDALDLAADTWTVLGWCLKPIAPAAVDGDAYDFRVTVGGVVLDTYTAIPRWSLGTPAASPVPFNPARRSNLLNF